MNKKSIKSLLFGAMFSVALGGMFTACSYDDSSLDERVSVLEGYMSEIKTQLANIQAAGSAIKNAYQNADGAWVLELSDGQVITLSGGAGIKVVETDTNFIFTVDGVDYVILKGAAAASLIYSPEYEDGLVVIENTDPVMVSFLVSGKEIKNLDGATFGVMEAHELKTRAASNNSSMFKTVEGATINGNILNVPVKALGVDADKKYALCVVAEVNGVEYVSNYFTVKMGPNYYFSTEDLEDYGFAASVTDAVKGDQNVWTATLPVALEDGVDFASLFTGLPAGCTFEIGQQVANVSPEALTALRSGLAADGKFDFTMRPGQDFAGGFVVNIVLNDVVKMKVNWIYVDPIRNVDFKGVYNGKCGAHIEIRGGDAQPYEWLPAGVNDIDMAKDFSDAADGTITYSPMHDGGRFINELWTQYTAELKDKGDIIYHDGTRYVTGDLGTKLAKGSRGVYWTSHQISVGSSNRRNLDRPFDEGSDDNIAWCGGNCNGELTWDGLPGEGRVLLGIDLKENGHLVTTENYQGWNMRIGVWIYYEYLYGQACIGGDALVWTWLNRRACPDGVDDGYIIRARDGQL